jgi:hypothetical protein
MSKVALFFVTLFIFPVHTQYRPCLECCVTNTAMHSDLSQYGTTFSAQSVLRKKQDLHGAFTTSVVDEGSLTEVAFHNLDPYVTITARRRALASNFLVLHGS